MAKFSDIAKGRRARTAITVEFGGAPVVLDVRVLGADEDIAIEAEALLLARKEVESADEASAVTAKYRAALVCLHACVDHESPEDSPARFFDSVDQILKSEVVTSDHIAILVAEQERFQDECSPLKRKLTTAEYISAVARTAQGEKDPFCRFAPGLQWSFARSMASQLLDSPTFKSPPSSGTSATSESSNAH